jgi:hypothetical protein
MTSGFNSQENKKLLYELSLDLVENRYNFRKLGTTTVQQVRNQLSDFLDQQHTLIYKNRFNYIDGGVKAMNKDMLRGANDFLYHLYKEYKKNPPSHSPSNSQGVASLSSQTIQNPELKVVYERPTQFKANEDTQTYKQERQSSLEQVMREKQNDLQSYFNKPTKEINFADKEEDKMNSDELESLLKRRQQEDNSLQVQHPQLSDLSGSENLIPKKVSFGTASVRPFDNSEPSQNVKSNQLRESNESIMKNEGNKQPTANNFLNRLKSQHQNNSIINSNQSPQSPQSQKSEPNLELSSYINDSASFIKRLCLIISSTNISHHFLRLRGERTTQTSSQQQSNLVRTIMENIPVDLTTTQKTHIEDFFKKHHNTIWRWWEFLEDIKRQGTAKQTNWWFDYFDIDNPYLDTFPRELREWMTQPIRVNTKG